jgi:hypothetical protein
VFSTSKDPLVQEVDTSSIKKESGTTSDHYPLVKLNLQDAKKMRKSLEAGIPVYTGDEKVVSLKKFLQKLRLFFICVEFTDLARIVFCMAKCGGASLTCCSHLEKQGKIPASYVLFLKSMEKRFINPDKTRLWLSQLNSVK